MLTAFLVVLVVVIVANWWAGRRQRAMFKRWTISIEDLNSILKDTNERAQKLINEYDERR